MIVDFLRKELKPKDLRVIPGELTFENHVELMEHTLVLNWMKSWLRYVHWYYTVAMDLDPDLAKLFEVPLVETSWKGTKLNKDLYRFGLIWKVYDMVTIRGINWRPGILPSIEIKFDRWILGGYTGNDFIMTPVDLRNPL